MKTGQVRGWRSGARWLAVLPARHWRGQLRPGVMIVAALLAPRLILALGSGRIPPHASPVAGLAFGGLSGLVLIWQLVGAVRTLLRDRTHGAVLALGVAGIVATVAIFTNAELNRFAASAGPAPAGSPQAQPLPVRGEVLEIHGDITWPLLTRLEVTLAQHPELRVAELDSSGGLIHAARAMAQQIEARGLDTRATRLCASACTLLFIAGAQRSLGPQGVLGFHAYHDPQPNPLMPIAPEEARDRAYLAARGVTQGFADRVFATPHARLWRPDRAALRAAGVLRP